MMAEGGRDFEVSLRGYDKRQVDAYVARSRGRARRARPMNAIRPRRAVPTWPHSWPTRTPRSSRCVAIWPRARPTSPPTTSTPGCGHGSNWPSRSPRASATRPWRLRPRPVDWPRTTSPRSAARPPRTPNGCATRPVEDLRRATEAAQQREADAEAVHSEARARAAEQLNSARTEADRLLDPRPHRGGADHGSGQVDPRPAGRVRPGGAGRGRRGLRDRAAHPADRGATRRRRAARGRRVRSHPAGL